MCFDFLHCFYSKIFFILGIKERDMIKIVQGEHKVFPWLWTFITRKLLGIQTYFFFQNLTQNKKFFLQHISTLQHVLRLLHEERLIDNQFLSTCSPTYLQLLYFSFIDAILTLASYATVT